MLHWPKKLFRAFVIFLFVCKKCSSSSWSFATKLTSVCKCVWKMLGFHMISNIKQKLLIMITKSARIWPILNSYYILNKILWSNHTRKKTFIHWCLFMYFNYYHISHIITLHFFHVAFAYDFCKLCLHMKMLQLLNYNYSILWARLCQRYALFVLNTSLQTSQTYENVFGKCMDSIWFLVSLRLEHFLLQRLHLRKPISSRVMYLSKSSREVKSP